MNNAFKYQPHQSAEENFLTWHALNTSERDTLNLPSLKQAEAQEIFCTQYDVSLDLANYFEKIIKTS